MHLCVGFLSALAGLSLLSAAAAAAQSGHGSAEDFELVCRATGGQWIDMPPGNAITACCDEAGCVICDENGNDCVHDPAYSRPSGAGLLLPHPNGTAAPLSPLPAPASTPQRIMTPR